MTNLLAIVSVSIVTNWMAPAHPANLITVPLPHYPAWAPTPTPRTEPDGTNAVTSTEYGIIYSNIVATVEWAGQKKEIMLESTQIGSINREVVTTTTKKTEQAVRTSEPHYFGAQQNAFILLDDGEQRLTLKIE